MWGKLKIGQRYKDSVGRIWLIDEIRSNEVALKTADNRLNVVSLKQLNDNFKKI
jgi:hypothetical protein